MSLIIARSADYQSHLLALTNTALRATSRACICDVTPVTLHSTLPNRKSPQSQNWLLLIHQLPPRPTNLRVRIWRKLQKLGAVAIKNSVYVLPANEKTNEDFQWLKQEIESSGGEVSVFRADSVEGATDKEIISAFRKARDDEFIEVTSQLDGLAGSIRKQTRSKHLSAGRLTTHEAELNRLHAELEHIAANDFFAAKSRAAALRAYESCQKLLRASQAPAPKEQREGLFAANYQGRRWMTRKNIHVDRLASAWLIKQFIDKQPRFYFVSEGEALDNAIPFDMFGAEFTHHGEDCTFETMIKRFGLDQIKGLRELSEIVHDIDLKDDRFHRLEAAGLKVMIDGLCESIPDDRKRLQQAGAIFDGLFAVLDKPNLKAHKNVRGTTKAVRKK